MGFILFNAILVLIILFLLFILSWVWPPDSPWSFWWRTSKEKARAVCKLAKISKNDVVFELGSGEGNMLIIAAKEFGALGVGIEIDPLRYYLSKLFVWLSKLSSKIEIRKNNFFDVNFSDATVVYVYLIPKALNRLKPKFLQELKPGTRIVSLRYTIDLPLKKRDEKNNLFLYTIL